MKAQRIGWYDLLDEGTGLVVRQRPGLCNWLRGTEPRLILGRADVQRAVRVTVKRGMPHGSSKPTRLARRWHVAFFDSRDERVGPQFHFASEAVARDFAVRITPRS